MRTRVVVALALVVLLAMTGCSLLPGQSGILPDTSGAGPSLRLVSSEVGWAEVEVSGVTSGYGDYRIVWGDCFGVDGNIRPEGYSNCPASGMYGHWYGSPAVYAASLVDSIGQVVDAVRVPVDRVQHYLEFVSLEGHVVTVRAYGVGGQTYSIFWGDTSGTTVTTVSPDGTVRGVVVSHTYALRGSYALSMHKDGDRLYPIDSTRQFFTVAITAD